MKRLIIALLLAAPAPALSATTSAQLETIAKTLEQNPAPSTTLNSQLLTLLREPAKTLDGVTLPSTAAQYTTSLDTTLKLRPKGWVAGSSEELPSAAAGVNCTAHLSLWLTDPALPNGGPGLRTEAYAWGKGNCPSVLSAAIARAWSYKLEQVGR